MCVCVCVSYMYVFGPLAGVSAPILGLSTLIGVSSTVACNCCLVLLNIGPILD